MTRPRPRYLRHPWTSVPLRACDWRIVAAAEASGPWCSTTAEGRTSAKAPARPASSEFASQPGGTRHTAQPKRPGPLATGRVRPGLRPWCSLACRVDRSGNFLPSPYPSALGPRRTHHPPPSTSVTSARRSHPCARQDAARGTKEHALPPQDRRIRNLRGLRTPKPALSAAALVLQKQGGTARVSGSLTGSRTPRAPRLLR